MRGEQQRAVPHDAETERVRDSAGHIDHPQAQIESDRIEHVHRNGEHQERERKRRRPPPTSPASQHQHAPGEQQQRDD